MKDLGQILKSQRKKRKLTYDKVYALAKIHPKYLGALENNDYSVFDGELHARGFLKIYADLLGLDVEKVLALWRREYGHEVVGSSVERRVPSGGLHKLKDGFSLSADRLFWVAVSIVFLAFFGYIYRSYKTYQGPPDLTINFPEDNSVVTGSLVDVSGSTDIDSTVLVNGDNLLLKPDGSFLTSLRLREGVNTISIVSINKLDKKNEKVLTLIYRPEEVPEVPEKVLEEPPKEDSVEDISPDLESEEEDVSDDSSSENPN
jgi:hypothetical protein